MCPDDCQLLSTQGTPGLDKQKDHLYTAKMNACWEMLRGVQKESVLRTAACKCLRFSTFECVTLV